MFCKDAVRCSVALWLSRKVQVVIPACPHPQRGDACRHHMQLLSAGEPAKQAYALPHMQQRCTHAFSSRMAE